MIPQGKPINHRLGDRA